MCTCSSALGMRLSSAGSAARGMRSNAGEVVSMGRMLQQRRANKKGRRKTRQPAEGKTRCALLVAGHLAFHALHEKLDAAEQLVVGHLVLLEHRLAGVVDDRTLPDREAAIVQPGLDLLDLAPSARRAPRSATDTKSIAPSLTPHHVLAGLPLAVERVAHRLHVVRRPVDDGRAQVRLRAVGRHVAVPAEARACPSPAPSSARPANRCSASARRRRR